MKDVMIFMALVIVLMLSAMVMLADRIRELENKEPITITEYQEVEYFVSDEAKKCTDKGGEYTYKTWFQTHIVGPDLPMASSNCDLGEYREGYFVR